MTHAMETTVTKAQAKSDMTNGAGAFLGDNSLKFSLLNKLKNFPDEAKSQDLVYCNDGNASFVGASVGKADIGLWQEKLGLPLWLGLAIDGLIMAAPAVVEGWNNAIYLLSAISIGDDIAIKAHEIIADRLIKGEDAIINTSDNENVKAICRKVAQMHLSALYGEEFKPSEWRKIRAEAIEVSNQFDPVSVDGVCSACV